ncbi:hypothetical protein RJ640_010591 [Escallonia rubra]|uniref:Cytochrome P450 n=1 Tax=Escallonia rubra TaxID=112253 RepID=A0AA88R0S6_9ASTE|nr:hypothetical protein RJ640_010591 [Escallonia rubra]
MAFPLLALSAIFIFIFFAYKLYRRPRFDLPPGPRPWPIIGNILEVKPLLFRCLADWAEVYGPITSMWIGSSLVISVSSAESAKEVLKENDRYLADRQRNRAAIELSKDGNDLTFADYGPHYVKLRKVCNLHLFSPKSIEALRAIREDEVTCMVESIFKDCGKCNTLLVRKYLQQVAFNNITRMVIGKKFVDSEGKIDEQGLEIKAIITNQVKLSASIGITEHIPWLRWMFWLKKEGFRKHEAQKDQLFRAIMDGHMLDQKKGGGVKLHTLDMSLMIENKYVLREDTIVGLIWDMITAGTDTTAIVVEWALAELVKNPRVLKKAQEELDRVIGTDRVMIESDIPNLPYLKCVVKEALRLHPPTPLMLPHKANANVKIGGYDVPKGSTVIVNVWAISRDPNVWENPLHFRPERFLEEEVDIKGNDFRLLPFGSGRRVCPGALLGLTLVTSMLGHLLHHFNWSLPEGILEDEIDMAESPGLVAYMNTPLQVVPMVRLPPHCAGLQQ